MEDGESRSHDARTPPPGLQDIGVSGGDATMRAHAATAPGPEEGGLDRDVGMEDERRKATALETANSGGDVTTSADRPAPGPEEGGSCGDVTMEDEERRTTAPSAGHDARTPPPGLQDIGVSGGDATMRAHAASAPGPEEGGLDRDVGMEDERRKATALETANSGGDATTSADRPAPGPEEGGSCRDVTMEDEERRTTVPSAEETGNLGGDAMRGAERSVSGPEEGGSRGDVSMEDGESHAESRTSAVGPENEGGSGGGRMMPTDARTPLEPEVEEHSRRDGPEDQGDTGTEVTMGNVESSVPQEVMPTGLNRDDSAGNERQIPAEPVETRFSQRLRQATTGASASQASAALEGEGEPSDASAAPEGEGKREKENVKTPAGSQKGKKKEAMTRQQSALPVPLGLWEVIDVDALVRWCTAANLIGPNFFSRKTVSPLTSTSRNSRQKLRERCQLSPMMQRAYHTLLCPVCM
jgi:hypothetical protein